MLKTQSKVVRQLNDLYKRSPNVPGPLLQQPRFKIIPPVSALLGAAALVLLTPKPTANEDAILRRLKKEELERKILLDPPESPEPLPPPFTGGQDRVQYEVNTYWQHPSDPRPSGYGNRSFHWGPILGVRVGSLSSAIEILCHGWSFQPYTNEAVWRSNYDFNGPTDATNEKIVSIRRVDGQPDIGGNLPSPTPTGTPKPSTLADPNKLKRERGDRSAPAASPKYVDNRPTAPGAGWGHAVPNDKKRQTTKSGTPSASPAPAPTKIYFPQEKPPVETSSPLAPQPTPQERPFPPQSVPDGISSQSTPQQLAPPSQKTDTAPVPTPTLPSNLLPPAPVRSPSPPRAPTAIPAPNPPAEPVIIYGPSFDPGKGGEITFSTPPQNFVPNPTTLAPVPQTPTTVKPPTTPTPPKTPIEEIGQKLRDLAIPVGTIGVGITQILKRTTPEELEKAAAAGTCQTTQPGGCTTAAINKGNDDLKDFLKQNGLDAAAQVEQLRLLNQLDSKMGAQIPGGISGFLQKFARSIHLDKVINALTLITTLHNAAMLSRNLGSTLGEVTSQALAVIGIKDEDDNPIDINKQISQQVNELLEKALGADTWKGIKTTWNKANSVISSATNIMNTMRGLWDSSREVLEWTAENTGRIGNALKRSRVVGENAYRYMPEQVTHTNAWSLKVNRFREGTDSLDDAASSLSSVLSEVQNIQSEGKELKEQKERFDKNLAELTPKPTVDNKPVADAAAASKTASAAPEDAANVFRGEGDTDDA